jgi:hypothetical protein
MLLPLAANTASSPSDDDAPMRTCTDCPVASDICEATVRFQTSS